MAAKAKDMPRDVYDQALRDALDAEIASRPIRKIDWTPGIDAEIWRANQRGLGARPIAKIIAQVHGFGTRSSVEDRLRFIRKHGGPDKVPR